MPKVEIVYQSEGGELIKIQCEVEPGTTISEVLHQSGLEKQYPEIVDLSYGIYSTLATAKTVVKEGDRIEIYRPLKLDPKEKRRERAKREKQSRLDG